MLYRFVTCSCVAVTAADKAMEDRINGAYIGGLIADALTLGSHYEYDAQVIKDAYGGKDIDTYLAPGEQMGGTTHGVGWGRRNYHPGQKKGEQTDYGLYNLLTLDYFSKPEASVLNKPVDFSIMLPFWDSFVKSPDWGAWKCSQTRQAQQQVAQNPGLKSASKSTVKEQLGGFSNAMSVRHMAAYGVYDNEDQLAEAARDVGFTHKNQQALDGAEYVARVGFRLIHRDAAADEAAGKSDVDVLKAVIEAVGEQMGGWIQLQVGKGIKKYEEATDPARPLYSEEFVDDLSMTSMARLWDVGKTEPIKVGKASPTEGTLPSSIYIVLKYASGKGKGGTKGFDPAVKANAMVGGDNASRSVAIGSILGAFYGLSGIERSIDMDKLGPGKLAGWKSSIEKLAKLPLLKGTDKSEL